MAAVATPTWAEVQNMSQLVLDGINIVKGEVNGDKFLWETKWVDPESGQVIEGVWQSTVEKKK